MLKSMTGYGSSVMENNRFIVKIEIKSLNSKYFDLKMRLPSRYNEKEIELHKYLEKKLVRGKIDLSLSVKSTDPNFNKKPLNTGLIKSYISELTSLSTHMGIRNENILQAVLGIPEAFSSEIIDSVVEEDEWKLILNTALKACNNLEEFRNSEGSKLADEIGQYIIALENNESIIESMKDKRTDSINAKLKLKVEESLNGDYDKNRFEQEIIYYLEKLDITEEIDRLKTHLNYFKLTMNEAESGRKLGFITQEIGREINTIGSKANDSEIQQYVVKMKDDLEKIKQQLANIL